MKNQELQLTEGLFTIEAEERLETIQMATDVAESCCIDDNGPITVGIGASAPSTSGATGGGGGSSADGSSQAIL
jgi:hypothetical protein